MLSSQVWQSTYCELACCSRTSPYVAMLIEIAVWTLCWSLVVKFWRSVCSTHAVAASWVSLPTLDLRLRKSSHVPSLQVSLTYCGTTVVWGSCYLWQQAWPRNGYTFVLSGTTTSLDILDFLAYSVAYFATDLIFDWDIRFVVHHLLSLSAMVSFSRCSLYRVCVMWTDMRALCR